VPCKFIIPPVTDLTVKYFIAIFKVALAPSCDLTVNFCCSITSFDFTTAPSLTSMTLIGLL